MITVLLGLPLAIARPDSSGFIDSDAGNVRCHWKDEADARICDDVVVWAEEAWTAQVDEIGFRAPRDDLGEGGSSALDIYIKSAGGAGNAWVD